jgi:imidazolonepropionase-like amidohydrolase
MKRVLFLTFAVAVGCGGTTPSSERPAEPRPDAPLPPLPWDVEAAAPPEIDSPLVVLRGGTVMTATGEILEGGVVVMQDGKLVAVGRASDVAIPDGAEVVDVSGRFVTPGLIDTHSHMGVYAQPGVNATSDGNEATAPVTAEVWAGDSFWPQDPALPRAIAGGITTFQVLPGSANLIGGRGAVLKMHLGRSVSEMRFPGAPDSLKMACGENPKRVYGGRTSAPSTRMGNVAGYRNAFQDAVEYGRSFRDWQANHRLWQIKRVRFERARRAEEGRERRGGRPRAASSGGEGGDDAREGGEEKEDEPEDPGPAPAPPARDYGLEALFGVTEGRVLAHMHCYRADEMATMMELARDFGFQIRSFHHAVEAYKVRDLLAANDVSVSTWADWWGFKLEAFDAIPENLALLTEAGARGIVHSDSASGIQRLNQEAAKAMAAGRRAGIEVTDDQALRWITANPAWALGVDARTGTLEPGKMADVVVWSASPFSVYARAERVYADGILVYDRGRDGANGLTDFETGLDAGGGR